MMSGRHKTRIPKYPNQGYPYPNDPYAMQRQYTQVPYMNDYHSKHHKKRKKRDYIYDDYYDGYYDNYYRQGPSYYQQQPSYYQQQPYWDPMQQYPPQQMYDEAPTSASRILSYVQPIMEVVRVLGPSLMGFKSFMPFL